MWNTIFKIVLILALYVAFFYVRYNERMVRKYSSWEERNFASAFPVLFSFIIVFSGYLDIVYMRTIAGLWVILIAFACGSIDEDIKKEEKAALTDEHNKLSYLLHEYTRLCKNYARDEKVRELLSARKYEEAISRISDNEKAITNAKQQYTYGDKCPKITDYIAFEKYEKEIDTVLQNYRDILYEEREYIRIIQGE